MSRRKTWRCFFCDEVFTRRQDAAEHFGTDDREVSDEPACQIKAHEGHLVHALRKAHDEIKRCLAEDSDVMRSLLELEVSSAEAVRRAEEEGYGRGVADMLAQSCPDCVARVRGEPPCGCNPGESCSDCDPEGHAFSPTTEKATWLE